MMKNPVSLTNWFLVQFIVGSLVAFDVFAFGSSGVGGGNIECGQAKYLGFTSLSRWAEKGNDAICMLSVHALKRELESLLFIPATAEQLPQNSPIQLERRGPLKFAVMDLALWRKMGLQQRLVSLAEVAAESQGEPAMAQRHDCFQDVFHGAGQYARVHQTSLGQLQASFVLLFAQYSTKRLREKLDVEWSNGVKSEPSSEEVLKVFDQLSPMPFSKLGFSDRKLRRFMSEVGNLWRPSVAPEVENLLRLSFDGLLVESNMNVGEWFDLMDQSLRARLAELDR